MATLKDEIYLALVDKHYQFTELGDEPPEIEAEQLEQIAQYLEGEVEDEAEWATSQREWLIIGHHIHGFLQWRAEHGN